MATTSKSTTTAKTATKKAEPVKEKETAVPVIDEEKEQLRAQLAEQQKRMEEMMAQMQVLMQAQSNTTAPRATNKSNRKIKFVNMCTGKLILRGTSLWEIDGQFNDHDFSETEANIIVNNMSNTIRSGCVYIADAQYIEEHDLQSIYDNLLSDEQMIDLLNHDYKYVVDMYKSASDAQKKIIIDTIVSKRARGEYVDANILSQLGGLCGRDLMGITSLDNEE